MWLVTEGNGVGVLIELQGMGLLFEVVAVTVMGVTGECILYRITQRITYNFYDRGGKDLVMMVSFI